MKVVHKNDKMEVRQLESGDITVMSRETRSGVGATIIKITARDGALFITSHGYDDDDLRISQIHGVPAVIAGK